MLKVWDGCDLVSSARPELRLAYDQSGVGTYQPPITPYTEQIGICR